MAYHVLDGSKFLSNSSLCPAPFAPPTSSLISLQYFIFVRFSLYLFAISFRSNIDPISCPNLGKMTRNFHPEKEVDQFSVGFKMKYRVRGYPCSFRSAASTGPLQFLYIWIIFQLAEYGRDFSHTFFHNLAVGERWPGFPDVFFSFVKPRNRLYRPGSPFFVVVDRLAEHPPDMGHTVIVLDIPGYVQRGWDKPHRHLSVPHLNIPSIFLPGRTRPCGNQIL